MAGLSIRSLRVFDAVLLSGTLGAAANSLNISVSAASRQLLELERDVGLTLFERTNRALKPTRAGLRFHAEMQPVLQGLNELPAIVDGIRTEDHETVSVIAMPRLSLGLLAPLQGHFARIAPDVNLNSSVLRRHDIQRWAASRTFDLGLGMLPVGHRALTATPLADVRAATLLREDHPLAEQEEITLEDLTKTRLIGYHSGLMVRDHLDQMFANADIAPNFVSETSSTLLACQLAAHGVGAAIIDYIAAWPFLQNERMRLRPIRGETWWPVGMFHRVEDQPNKRKKADLMRALKDTLEEVASGGGRDFVVLRPVVSNSRPADWN